MGTDIHPIIEYAENGIYYAFARAGIERDYALFASLGFNRRGMYGNSRLPPRGLPSDMSREVREIFFVPNNFYFNLVKIEPESVNEVQFTKLLEHFGEFIINYYKETSYAPVWAYVYSVKLNKILSEKDIIRLAAEAKARNLNDFLYTDASKIYDDKQLKGIFKRFTTCASNQYKRTDVVRYEEVERLQLFLESYGDWAIREYEATGLIPDSNWHTASWLNFNELKEILAGYLRGADDFLGGEESALEKTLWTMENLAEKYGNENVRLVFWFDN